MLKTRAYIGRSNRFFAKLAVAGVVLGGGAAAGAATTGVFNAGQSSAPAFRATFAVLRTPPTPMPALTHVLRGLGADRSTDGHLALTSGRFRLFAVVPSGAQDLVCLTVNGHETVNTCSRRASLGSTDLVWITHAEPNNTYDVYGLAPDGISGIQVGGTFAQVKNNAFLIQGIPDSAGVAIEHGNGATAEVKLAAPVIPAGVTVVPNP